MTPNAVGCWTLGALGYGVLYVAAGMPPFLSINDCLLLFGGLLLRASSAMQRPNPSPTTNSEKG